MRSKDIIERNHNDRQYQDATLRIKLHPSINMDIVRSPHEVHASLNQFPSDILRILINRFASFVRQINQCLSFGLANIFSLAKLNPFLPFPPDLGVLLPPMRRFRGELSAVCAFSGETLIRCRLARP